MIRLSFWLAASLAILQIYVPGAGADGIGLIGYGKTLYNPTCTFACRNVIRRQSLGCTPKASSVNHGTAHNPVSTPPQCFVQDLPFLKTMALCIDTYCTLSDRPSMSLIEDYWASHLGTGTLGNYKYTPVLSYKDALAGARQDENDARASQNTTSHAARHGGHTSETVPDGLMPFEVSSPLAITSGGSGSLNKTSLVSPVQWQLQYNYLSDFEVNETGHSTMTIVIAIVAIFLPIVLSLIRFIPGTTASHGWNYFKSTVIHPATYGKSHRQPVAGGMVPTRGQTLYILVISFLNIILLVAPYTITQPQASFTTRDKQTLSIIGNRAGTMAMGNVVALFLFSSRNSFLLYITDWSYGTYLLLHRWLGYWAVIQTVIHSCMLWSYYVKAGSYAAELLRLYWVWGIVGTVAACALIPFSLLKVRQKFYEFFIVSHVILSLLFLIGYYYHIWYVYTYNWGYEIWMFVAAAIWAVERLIRIGRMAVQGSRTAVVTLLPDSDGEYVRIDVEGKSLDQGVAYLCFPTLSWRFWETHPFSVCGPISDLSQGTLRPLQSDTGSNSSHGPDAIHEKGDTQGPAVSTVISGAQSHDGSSNTTFFARTRSGITKILAERASKSEGKRIRLRVLIEGPYNHSGSVHSQVAQCSSILCIAGGVGITACLPLLRLNQTKPTKLFWSSRKAGLVADLNPTLNALSSNVKVQTLVGERFDLDAIIYQELVDVVGTSKGPLAIVISGPPGLSDDVRHKVTQIARSYEQSRTYVLVDEAFSW